VVAHEKEFFVCEALRGSKQVKTVALLIVSNAFMTIAWYGHLKYKKEPLIAAVLVSW
jgi:uncharacterized protein (DUF486 family)